MAGRSRTGGIRLACGVLALAVAACAETEATRAEGSVSVLSWNVSSDAFLRDPAAVNDALRLLAKSARGSEKAS